MCLLNICNISNSDFLKKQSLRNNELHSKNVYNHPDKTQDFLKNMKKNKINYVTLYTSCCS